MTASSCLRRGTLGQKSSLPAFSARTVRSASLYPMVGGTVFSTSALMANTASMAPAAPKQCPVIALVELTDRLSFLPSKIVCRERNSASSFLAVPVPCAFT